MQKYATQILEYKKIFLKTNKNKGVKKWMIILKLLQM